MALKIIGTGFGRTGTMSVYTALNQLGFPCYHMFEVIENKQNRSHLDFWRKVANSEPGSQHDWEQVFARYTATVDNPGCCVWRELMAAYPDAKVIHTLHPRGAEGWYESTLDTIYFTQSSWQFWLLSRLAPFPRRFRDMCNKLIWHRNHEDTLQDRARALAHYQRHLETIKAAVPAGRLLVFSVDQGWKPLCDFLGVPVPATPFPNVNDRKEIKKVIRTMTLGAYAVVGVAAAALAALVFALLRFAA